jgi:ubiquinone/menaquinone biosynthesis C-methylase UbiE
MVATPIKRLLKQQFGHPTGILGHVAGWIMALQNRDRTAWAVEQINANRDDHILEIGIGPGVAIQLLTEIVLDGYIAGIDISPVMIDHASTRNYPAIQNGRVDLRLASVEQLPFDDGAFDKVFAINTLHHWENPDAGMKAVHRVLKAGGKISIVEQPRGTPDSPENADTIAKRIQSQLLTAGFDDFSVTTKSTDTTPIVCVQASKP